MPTAIEDYALVGDCETAALVSRSGSIDWLCWPRFDSDACFAALLGTADHGRWSIAPAQPGTEVTRRYWKDTLILETRFKTSTGSVLVIDFMPPRDGRSDLVRLVIGEHGHVAMTTELLIRFGYGATVPWVTHEGPNTWHAVAGPDLVVLNTPAAMRGEDLRSVAEFVVAEGQMVPFTLTYSPSHLQPPEPIDVDAALKRTQDLWLEWVGRGHATNIESDTVIRSLITLRALIYKPTGGMVAAPTTSLPERLGGHRNWDYRYCWLRDATLTLLSLMNAGYFREAGAWRDWLLRAVAGSPGQLQIMYGLGGERRLTEWEVPWLPGYENSKPVRIGNAAHAQLQLDVYGELMDALYQARLGGLPQDDAAWSLQLLLLEHLETVWSEPDYGMWEVRGPARHFVYSKVMAWVAFDRAIKTAERFRLKGPVRKWNELRRTIFQEIHERGFDHERNTFRQSFGEPLLDANLLLLPAVGFIRANDARMKGTVTAIEKTLLRDGFVLRYDSGCTDDGLPAGEGAFLACSFWLADVYAMMGRVAEAEALYKRLVMLCNDVGLLAEEYDPRSRRLVGNFPQAFSHVALVNTAANLRRAAKPAEQRSETSIPHGKRKAVARAGHFSKR